MVKARWFNIELAPGDQIQNAVPDSELLMDAFNYVDDTNRDDAAQVGRYSIPIPVTSQINSTMFLTHKR